MAKKNRMIFLIFICMSVFLVACGSESNAENLAEYAKEQFMANDYEDYVKNLREKSGLNDLDIEMNVVYNYDYEYDKQNKELMAEGHISFISDEIDNYYSEGSHETELKDLVIVLNKLKEAYYENPRYVYTNSNGTVYLDVKNGVSDQFFITTSSGREYKFSYYGGYDDIEVDGDLVYIEKNSEYKPSSTASNSNFNSYTGAYDATLEYGSGSVLVCISKDAMDRYLTAINNDNQGTIEEMEKSGEVGWTAKGTKCNIVDRGIGTYKVKLLDGIYSGNTVYVISESVNEK